MEGYGELCTLFYDLDKPRAPELALAWYQQQLSAVKGRILEPMCGSGRFLIPLVQAGLKVDGVDASAPMLEACRARLPEGCDTRLWHQSIEQLNLGEKFAAAFIPAASFCLLDELIGGGALIGLQLHLDPGAPVLIEFEPPHEVSLGETVRTVNDGKRQIRLVSRSEYDPATRIETMHNRYELRQSGKLVQTEDETLHLHCFTPEQMEAQLEGSGYDKVVIEHQPFGRVARAEMWAGA